MPERHRRVRLQPEERRELLLDAATTAFLEHGYGSTTIRDIAQGAGVAPALIYRHFANKSEMLTAIVTERGPSTRLSIIDAEWEHLSLHELLVEAVRQILTAFADHRDTALIIESQRITDPDIAAALARQRAQGVKAISAFLAPWEQRGELRTGCRPLLASSLVVLCEAYFIENALSPQASGLAQLNVEDFAEQTATFLEHGCGALPGSG